jgi:hypothetical protein
VNSLDFLAGPTGGLVYHFSALRFRKRLWQPFLSDVNAWLEDEWQPKSRELLLFGPSAGWTLPERFLEKFDLVTCVEPDLSARALLRLRFRKVRFKMLSDPNILPWFANAEKWHSFLFDHKNSAVLFANLLGQLPLLWKAAGVTPEHAAHAQKVFSESLIDREWASFHDIFSAREKILAGSPKSLEGLTKDEDLALQFFHAGSSAVDHETSWLLSGQKNCFSTWQIRPGRNHVIAFIHNQRT